MKLTDASKVYLHNTSNPEIYHNEVLDPRTLTLRTTNRHVVHRNYAINPNPVNLAPVPSFSVGGGQYVASYISGATDGPTPEITNYQRRTCTSTSTSGTLGPYNYDGAPADVQVGSQWSVGVWFRCSIEWTARLNLSVRLSDRTQAGSVFYTSYVTIPANTWVRMTHTFTADAAGDSIGWWIYTPLTVPPPIGTTFDVAGFTVVSGSELPATFNGSHSPDPLLTPSWEGTENNSSSVLEGYPPLRWSGSASRFYIRTDPIRNVPVLEGVRDGTGSVYLDPANNTSSYIRNLPEGKWYAYAVDVYTPDALIASTMRLTTAVYSGTMINGSSSAVHQTNPINEGVWTRLMTSGRITSNNGGEGYMRLIVWPSTSAGGKVRVNRANLVYGNTEDEVKKLAWNYMDGSEAGLPGYSTAWTGTPHQSASIATRFPERAQAAYLGTHRLAHLRTNLYAPGLVRDRLGQSQGSGAIVSAANGVRSFVMPVEPGETYTVRRTTPLSSRFRWSFTAVEPAPTVVSLGGYASSLYDASAEPQTMTAPPGAYWLLIYLSNAAGETISPLVIEKGNTAGAYFDGDTPRAEWVGVPGASASILWDAN